MDRRTKIVATLGPASDSAEVIDGLVAAGVDVVRCNAAHGTVVTHGRAAELTRAAAARHGRIVGILVDLPGPKLRTGPVEDDVVYLDAGQTFTLVGHDIEGDELHVSTTIDSLADMVEPGTTVFLADGEIVLRAEAVRDRDVICTVLRGGALRSRKGMYVPGVEHRVAAFTDADAMAIDMALEIKADFIGLSFVRNAEDVERVRERLPKRGPSPSLVAKIETGASLDHLDEIARAADALMVARGDLGIQVDIARVPLIQKDLIGIANRTGTPVITATQVLTSMTRSPIPTRAEVTDVANAVLDGTDALMLSEETAVGSYPVLTVQTMAHIAATAEEWPRQHAMPQELLAADDSVSWAVAHATAEAATDLDVAAILCPTRTGATPRRVAAFRPRVPVIACSDREDTLARCTLLHGVYPVSIPFLEPGDVEIERCIDAAKAGGFVQRDEFVVVASANPGPRAGSTDALRVIRVK
ncbi:MAG: pyruvate kinase [Acidimicrobiia bacterium]